jgi:hypothetical protein
MDQQPSPAAPAEGGDMDQQPSPAACPSVVTTVAIVLFVRGGLSILLNLREQARMVAFDVVGIDAVLTIIFLVQGAGGASSASRWMRSSSGRS